MADDGRQREGRWKKENERDRDTAAEHRIYNATNNNNDDEDKISKAY
jgi:hypothetical protein